MMTFIAVAASVMAMSACELLVLAVIMPSSDPGPATQRFLFDAAVPIVDGLAAFSTVWVAAKALSWFQHSPSPLMVILVGIFLIPGRIRQMKAQSIIGVLLALMLHFLGTALGGLYVL